MIPVRPAILSNTIDPVKASGLGQPEKRVGPSQLANSCAPATMPVVLGAQGHRFP